MLVAKSGVVVQAVARNKARIRGAIIGIKSGYYAEQRYASCASVTGARARGGPAVSWSAVIGRNPIATHQPNSRLDSNYITLPSPD